ncbi:FtsX-like permease family protein [Chitinimonas koreensis]|uniref:FtsX-like permease family protein n=1 Tax=Chitinimonas koreensis TaxID=356302 RepID=UPI00165427E7|nr:FtsX-like permease family protein [Chitinimonas koreensis]QNM97424.1 FtsX-like permease family protein [Chitinimonas koreensis]
MQSIFDATAWSAEFEPSSRINGHAAEIRLMPLQRLPFDGARAPASVALYGGLAALAVVILALAGINYVNLGTVRALQRQREIGIRKSLGASPGRVMRQFLAESLLAALLATALGLALARLAWPLLVEQLGKRYDTPFVPSMLLAAVLIGVLAGLLAGLYPAWVAARVPAGQVLAGRDRQEGAGGLWLRRGLTVLQFAAAIALSALALAIALQTRHAIRIDPGFDAAPLLVVDAPPRLVDAEIEQLREALARLPGVRAAARSGDAPGRRLVRASSTVALPGSTRMLSFRHESVDPNFFPAYGIRPLAGRLFAPDRDTLAGGEEVVLNRSAAAQFGFASPQAAIGRAFRRDDLPLRVAGVIEDIRHVSLREPPEPTYYRIERDQIPTITLRAEGDRAALKAAVEALWLSRYPGEAPRVEWLSKQLEEVYGDDLRLSQALLAAADVATLIAGFGLYALAAYSVRRRAREIAIRKLYGAGRGAIAALLVREFGVLLLLGAVVGLPLGWLAIGRYLDGFVERAPLGVWPLVAAVLAASLVAALAVSRHLRAALASRPAQVIEG